MWKRVKAWLSPPKRLHIEIPGDPSNIEIIDRQHFRVMRFTDAPRLVQGKRHHQDLMNYGLDYLRQHLLATCAGQPPKTMLILGLGVGALPTLCRAIYPELQITIIELNKSVIEAAHTYFAFKPSSGCKVVHADAADWLAKHSPGQFDLIFNDCFDGLQSSLQMRQTDILKRLTTHLSTDGILVTNLLKHQQIPCETWFAEAHLHGWVWAAEHRSNLTFVLGRQPLDWQMIQCHAEQVDAKGILSFELTKEIERLNPVS